ncbi:MAG: hypothetical protein HUJ58_07705, partial [Erysipelotrichaceae bacterium]|nr:hypothetical protein [Erysipelotrichaceae bacterium]
YALELSILEYLPMYGRDTFIFTEESVVFDDDRMEFLTSGRDRMSVVGRK